MYFSTIKFKKKKLISIYNKKKKKKNFEYEYLSYLDTLIQCIITQLKNTCIHTHAKLKKKKKNYVSLIKPSAIWCGT